MHGNDSNVERCAKHRELRQGRVPGAGALRFTQAFASPSVESPGFERRGLMETMVANLFSSRRIAGFSLRTLNAMLLSPTPRPPSCFILRRKTFA